MAPQQRITRWGPGRWNGNVLVCICEFFGKLEESNILLVTFRLPDDNVAFRKTVVRILFTSKVTCETSPRAEDRFSGFPRQLKAARISETTKLHQECSHQSRVLKNMLFQPQCPGVLLPEGTISGPHPVTLDGFPSLRDLKVPDVLTNTVGGVFIDFEQTSLHFALWCIVPFLGRSKVGCNGVTRRCAFRWICFSPPTATTARAWLRLWWISRF